MTRALGLAAAILAITACGSTSGATKQYRSPAGYSLSYPSSWTVTASRARTFSASAPNGDQYLVVIVLDASLEQVMSSHRGELEGVGERTESREVQTSSARAPELWSTRTEKDGRVGIYQQYFLSMAVGTVWVQHGCFEPGPDLTESADRDCDDSGSAIVASIHPA